MQIKTMIQLILKGVALAMGVAVTVLAAVGELEPGAAISMLGLGLSCLAVAALSGDRA